MKLSSGILGLTLSSVVALASANAADMYAPGPGGYKDFGPIATWAGFYAGVNGGYAWDTEVDLAGGTCYTGDFEGSPACGSKAASAIGDGGFGGGQIGYNIQRDRLVFGLEADFEGSGLTGSSTISDTEAFTSTAVFTGVAKAESDLDWFGTVRGRLGLTFPDPAGLIYVTGGLAYGEVQHKLTGSVSYNGSLLGSTSVSLDDTKAGWVLGAGYEHFVTPRLSLKFEYQFIDLGSENLTFTSSHTETITGYGPVTRTSTLDSSFSDSFSTVRAGVNYHIGAVYEPLK